MDLLKENKVSCHYLVPEQNETELYVYEVVKPPLRAWHAGVSQWQKYQGLNDYAIGIEINMPNYALYLENKTLDFFAFQEFQTKQIDALKILLKQLQSQYNIPAENIIGHSDIAPFRNLSGNIVLGKTDPGPTLPWEKLAAEGIGVWPSDECDDEIDLSAEHAQELLKRVGYQTTDSGKFDAQTNFTLGAARLHWTPTCFNSASGFANDCYDKPFDQDLACRLKNLADKNYTNNNSNSSSLMLILLCTGTPLLIVFLALVAYKLFSRKQKANYDVIPEESEVVQEPEKNETSALSP